MQPSLNKQEWMVWFGLKKLPVKQGILLLWPKYTVFVVLSRMATRSLCEPMRTSAYSEDTYFFFFFFFFNNNNVF